MASNATVPNLEFLFLHNINLDSHPAEWFNIFFSKSCTKNTHPKGVKIEEFQSWKNTKAMVENAGRRGEKYKGIKDFTEKEMMTHLGVYLLHGIPPAPQIEMKFISYLDDPVNGSNMCNNIFGRSGVTCHKEFKTFFACVSPLLPTTPSTSHPNWKLDPLLKHMMRVAKDGMHIGQSISVDEMDIGFQG